MERLEGAGKHAETATDATGPVQDNFLTHLGNSPHRAGFGTFAAGNAPGIVRLGLKTGWRNQAGRVELRDAPHCVTAASAAGTARISGRFGTDLPVDPADATGCFRFLFYCKNFPGI